MCFLLTLLIACLVDRAFVRVCSLSHFISYFFFIGRLAHSFDVHKSESLRGKTTEKWSYGCLPLAVRRCISFSFHQTVSFFFPLQLISVSFRCAILCNRTALTRLFDVVISFFFHFIFLSSFSIEYFFICVSLYCERFHPWWFMCRLCFAEIGETSTFDWCDCICLEPTTIIFRQLFFPSTAK